MRTLHNGNYVPICLCSAPCLIDTWLCLLYQQEESYKHCLWVCLESPLLWKCLLISFSNYFPPSIFTWGMVAWTPLDCFVFHCGGPCFEYLLLNGLGSSLSDHVVFRMQPLWELLSSTTNGAFGRLDAPPYSIKLGSHELKWLVTFCWKWPML